MTESDRCLVPWNVYGDGVIRLEFHKDRCLIDLARVMDDAFKYRDYHVRPEYPRSRKTAHGKDYFFSLIELADTIFPTCRPEVFAQFLEEHLTDETEQSAALTEKVRRFEETERIVLKGSVHNSPASYFAPLNFPDEEFEAEMSKMPAHFRSMTKVRRAKLFMTRKDFKERVGKYPVITIDDSLSNLREYFLNGKPRIVTYPLHCGIGENFDIWNLIKRYNLPTDGLKIVRAEPISLHP